MGCKKLPKGRVIIQNVWLCICVPLLGSVVTFVLVDRFALKFKGHQNSMQDSLWRVLWTPWPLLGWAGVGDVSLVKVRIFHDQKLHVYLFLA